MTASPFDTSSAKSPLKSPNGKQSAKPVQRSILSFFTASSSPSKMEIATHEFRHALSDEPENTPAKEPLMACPISKRFCIGDDDDEEEYVGDACKGSGQPSFAQENIVNAPYAADGAFNFASFTSPKATKISSTPMSIPRSKNSAGIREDSQPPNSPSASRAAAAATKKKEEIRHEWLVDVCDSEGNRPGEPAYDSQTLYIPPAAWKAFTPFEKQYWEIKSQHYDCVVFFKKGKFYELYEGDADISAREFDLKVSDRINMRMSGVPEASFEYWASKFVARGYKVAKVEQAENMIAKEMREKELKSPAKADDKIIKRELSCILTAGTLVDAGMLKSDLATFCMALKVDAMTTVSEAAPVATFKVSAAFVDTATGQFYLSRAFVDDGRTFSGVETLLAQTRPKEFVLEKGRIPDAIVKIIKRITFSPLINYVKEFWSSDRARFEAEVCLQGSDAPEPLSPVLSDVLTADSHVGQSFGGLLEYLTGLRLSASLVSFNSFNEYAVVEQQRCFMQLDGQTLINLELFQNANNGSENGTLIKAIDQCVSPFGKRLLRFWLAHPLINAADINSRLRSVAKISNDDAFSCLLEALLCKSPDFERVLCRVHTGTCKLADFIGFLEHFGRVLDAVHTIKQEVAFDDECSDSRAYCILFDEFPAEKVKCLLHDFCGSFDIPKAKQDGVINPFAGCDAEFDGAQAALTAVEEDLDAYIKTQRKTLNCKDIKYKDIGKELFQMEIPMDACCNTPSDFIIMSKTKTVCRYWTARLKTLVKQFQEATERKRVASATVYSRLLAKFDAYRQIWSKATACLAELDCLWALSKASFAFGDGVCCRPVILPNAAASRLTIVDGRHPCLPHCIPNDVRLGESDGSSVEDAMAASMILLTGPNMGGKSTLLRMTCINVILAQIGCFVPATQMSLVPFTKLFTRIGANDNIIAGQSTFMVELTETSRILREADANSLVILDELGRGTSTYDGYAIAHATLHYLANWKRCRGLFSTHYHVLGEEMAHYPAIKQQYMNCVVTAAETENTIDDRVIFLYKLVDGNCPKSYGMNVAKMAGIPAAVVNRALAIADEFERGKILKSLERRNTKFIGEQPDADALPIAHALDLKYLEDGAATDDASRALIIATIDRFKAHAAAFAVQCC